MGAQGTTTIDFGAGKTDATVAVTGQAGILAGNVVAADIIVTASANNGLDAHAFENIKVRAGNIVAGTGFTIYVSSTDDHELFGIYTLAWAWN